MIWLANDLMDFETDRDSGFLVCHSIVECVVGFVLRGVVLIKREGVRSRVGGGSDLSASGWQICEEQEARKGQEAARAIRGFDTA